VNCIRCAGACCEIVTIDAALVDFPKVAAEWLSARGACVGGTVYAVESRCPKLTGDGLCGIHDEKPLACALMPVGGPECMDAVRLRRSPEQYAVIRDEDDPTPEQVYAPDAGPDGNPSFEACREEER